MKTRSENNTLVSRYNGKKQRDANFHLHENAKLIVCTRVFWKIVAMNCLRKPTAKMVLYKNYSTFDFFNF